jgi:tRNA threonylcarbamoyladenosine biosynthesis protein TsaB
MLILAIDTSGRHGSIALCRGDAGAFDVIELAPLEGGTYSARLMPTIASLLEQNHFDKKDVDGFVVVSGPGSFTGLRVGLATVKGLCEVLQKPLATVSMLEAVAIARGAAGHNVTAVLDAGRGEVYVGEYQAGSGVAKVTREYISKTAEFAEEAKKKIGELLTPDTSVFGHLEAAGIKIRSVDPVLADEIGPMGIRKLLAGDVADIASVDVNYIRRSDAEIFSAPKR